MSTTDYPVHPAAEIFPLMTDDELRELAEDIRINGLFEPIVLYQKAVLDGRSRMAACRLADVAPHFTEVAVDSPTKYVVSKNLHRRHLTVQARSLKIHPSAQRDMLPARLKYLIGRLNLDAIGTFHAVEYTIGGVSGIWVVDGQHRLRALLDLDLGDWEITVVVHCDVKDDAAASALFLDLNNRASVAPFDKFVNAVRAGDPVAVGVRQILGDYQVAVSRGANDGQACAVKALQGLYRLDGGVSLRRALAIITAAWGTSAAAMEGKIIEGIGRICNAYNGELDQASLIQKLAKRGGGPSRLLGDARGLRDLRKGSISRCVAEVILDTYNKGRKTGKLDPL